MQRELLTYLCAERSRCRLWKTNYRLYSRCCFACKFRYTHFTLPRFCSPSWQVREAAERLTSAARGEEGLIQVLPFCLDNGYFKPRSVYYGVALGFVLSVLLYASTNTRKAPEWFWMLSFAGFFVALDWFPMRVIELVGLSAVIMDD